MHPHDYYAPYSDEPKLHNRGAARPYVEPDWQANATGHQLPVLSTVGRGPRGEGLEVGNVVNEDGTVSFALYSTLTGELVWQSPNLAPSKIEFLPTDFRDLAAGQAAPLDIKVTRGGITETTHAYLPCGEQGSLIYVIPGVKDYNTSQTYQAKVGDLTIYNNNHWNNGHRPLPRVNDIVIVKIQQEDTVYLAVGDIVQVGSGVDHSGQNIDEETQLVYVVRTMIDNVGPKGDKGDPGEDALNNIKIVKTELPLTLAPIEDGGDYVYGLEIPYMDVRLEDLRFNDGWMVSPINNLVAISATLSIPTVYADNYANELWANENDCRLYDLLFEASSQPAAICIAVDRFVNDVHDDGRLKPDTALLPAPGFFSFFNEGSETASIWGLWFHVKKTEILPVSGGISYDGENPPEVTVPAPVLTIVYATTYDEGDYQEPLDVMVAPVPIM